MAFKPPIYAVQSIFSRVVSDVEPVRSARGSHLRGKCPLCKDYKKRMYCLEHHDHFQVHCHNCGYTTSFNIFIKDEYPNEYVHLKEFIIDSIKTGQAFKKREPKKKEYIPVVETDLKLRIYMEEMSFSLGETQETPLRERIRKMSIAYCEERKIPQKYWSEFRFFTHGTLKGYIGIPMWDDSRNNLVHIQGRLFIKDKNSEKPQVKYMFLKDIDHNIENLPKPFYGSWRVDKEKEVFVCEGTLDCLAFGDQGISTCGATISKFIINRVKKKFPNITWCMDNYWEDEAGRKLTDTLLDMEEKCLIIPKSMKSKDANALLQEMDVNIIPEDFIKENTYNGKLGKVKLGLVSK